MLEELPPWFRVLELDLYWLLDGFINKCSVALRRSGQWETTTNGIKFIMDRF